MRVKFARSARRHRIGTGRALAAMNDAGEPQVWESNRPERDDLLVWVGRDDRGALLEVIAVERPDVLLIIHVMPVHFYDR